ncbi:MAG: hypothetical protein ABJC89_15380 [Acidobacteriota bacterium]
MLIVRHAPFCRRSPPPTAHPFKYSREEIESMTRRQWIALLIWVMAASASRAMAADITGKWTASFDTQIGQQNYTYQFVVKDGTITGTAKSDNGESALQDGKVEGDTVTFVELLKFQDMEIRIEYTGKIASADEIKFTRKVGDFATEELVAKRAK